MGGIILQGVFLNLLNLELPVLSCFSLIECDSSVVYVLANYGSFAFSDLRAVSDVCSAMSFPRFSEVFCSSFCGRDDSWRRSIASQGFENLEPDSSRIPLDRQRTRP